MRTNNFFKKLFAIIGLSFVGAFITSGTIKSTSNNSLLNQSNETDNADFNPATLSSDNYRLDSNKIIIYCNENNDDFNSKAHNNRYRIQSGCNWKFFWQTSGIGTISKIRFILDGEGELVEDGTSLGTITKDTGSITWEANKNQVVENVKLKNASTSEIKFTRVYVTFQTTGKLTVVSEDETKGTVTGGQDIAITTFTYDLTAIPKEGYKFKGWTLQDSTTIFETANPWTYTFEQTTKIVARFEESYCDVTLTADPTGGGKVAGGGENIPYGSTTTLTATPNPGYDFLGFYDGDTLLSSTSPYDYTVTESKNLTAKFKIHTFTVIWQNDDGTVLETDTDVPYGTEPKYDGATPTKEGTAQYTYEFSGWSPTISSVTSDQTYTAQYKTITNKYTITFNNYDGSTLQSGLVDYGVTPVYSGATPTKPSTAQYEYSFSGWSPTVEAVTGDKTYIAQFSEKTRQYTITFKNYNGTVLQTSKLDYGATPSYSGTPTRPSTAEYSYTFTGWDSDIEKVTGNKTYTAQYSSTKNKYTISWLMDDGTLIDTTEVEYGTMPTHNIAVKPSTEQYQYRFNGWSPELKTVTGNATYKATFSKEVRKYNISFRNWNMDELQAGPVEYGEIPVYSRATPTKPSTVQYSYTFIGWNPEIVPVTSDAIYIAQFKEVTNKYTVKFVNDDGTVLQNSEVEYGETPSYIGPTPTKKSDVQYSYTFDDWDKEITSVTGDVVYTAKYTSSLRDYQIVFENDDGTVLQSDRVKYGETPKYTSETPIKPQSEKYIYTFAGWDHTISAVTGDDTYIAKYTSEIQKYYISFMNDNGIELQLKMYEYGAMPSYTGPTPTKKSVKQDIIGSSLVGIDRLKR